jgi:hypothetical protein
MAMGKTNGRPKRIASNSKPERGGANRQAATLVVNAAVATDVKPTLRFQTAYKGIDIVSAVNVLDATVQVLQFNFPEKPKPTHPSTLETKCSVLLLLLENSSSANTEPPQFQHTQHR